MAIFINFRCIVVLDCIDRLILSGISICISLPKTLTYFWANFWRNRISYSIKYDILHESETKKFADNNRCVSISYSNYFMLLKLSKLSLDLLLNGHFLMNTRDLNKRPVSYFVSNSVYYVCRPTHLRKHNNENELESLITKI